MKKRSLLVVTHFFQLKMIMRFKYGSLSFIFGIQNNEAIRRLNDNAIFKQVRYDLLEKENTKNIEALRFHKLLFMILIYEKVFTNGLKETINYVLSKV